MDLLQIERIQNKTVYTQYSIKKRHMEQTNPQGTTNERQLWHGLSKDAVQSVNYYGYNRSYCGNKNGTRVESVLENY